MAVRFALASLTFQVRLHAVLITFGTITAVGPELLRCGNW